MFSGFVPSSPDGDSRVVLYLCAVRVGSESCAGQPGLVVERGLEVGKKRKGMGREHAVLEKKPSSPEKRS